jgi:hypothetical protein
MISGFHALLWGITQRMVGGNSLAKFRDNLRGRIDKDQTSYISNRVCRWQHELGMIVDIQESISIDYSAVPSVVNRR